ncbi:hypothetical protein [Burkholderia sp. BCC0044]|uniref:hypothetical protein n=1 Tax=Burkholderia sp. BCC0044 TaxID=2676295 RepID=UPI001FC8A011|nr:hypothetical protein [Burkholderia sp. BCC0044]
MAGGARTARGGSPAEPDAHDITMKNRRRGPAGGTAHRVVRGRCPRLQAACGFGGAKAGSLRTERCAVVDQLSIGGRRSRRGGVRPHANGKRIAPAITCRSPAETRYKKSNKYFMREIL